MNKKDLLAQSESNDNEQKIDTHPDIKIEKHFPSLSEREIEAVEQFRDELDKELLNIKENGNFTALEMCDLLYPYMKDPVFLSRLHPYGASNATDSRHVNMNLAVAMRRVFDISIDAIVDKVYLGFPSRKPPQK